MYVVDSNSTKGLINSLPVRQVHPNELVALSADKTPLFLVDQARIPDALETVYQLDPIAEITWLYGGTRLEPIQDVGPFIYRGKAYLALIELWLKDHLWQSSVCMGLSSRDATEVIAYWRSLLIADAPHGLPRLFRFYSPRVLTALIPTLNDSERSSFLGMLESLFWVPQCQMNEADIQVRLLQHANERQRDNPLQQRSGWRLNEQQLAALESPDY